MSNTQHAPLFMCSSIVYEVVHKPLNCISIPWRVSIWNSLISFNKRKWSLKFLVCLIRNDLKRIRFPQVMINCNQSFQLTKLSSFFSMSTQLLNRSNMIMGNSYQRILLIILSHWLGVGDTRSNDNVWTYPVLLISRWKLSFQFPRHYTVMTQLYFVHQQDPEKQYRLSLHSSDYWTHVNRTPSLSKMWKQYTVSCSWVNNTVICLDTILGRSR